MTLLFCCCLLAGLGLDDPSGESLQPFAIQVVDEETGRGVPLVELKTVNNIRLVTDSNGVAAFLEPGLMDQRVYFWISSHGYEYPADGFGYRGKALDITSGGRETLKIRRINVAERLYRVTGAGIYADSVLVGEPTPTERPVLNGQVLGSDSVMTETFGGKIHWFWGDTNRPGYPLGNFHIPGATSELPENGGLDPSIGVNLDYFVNENGFASETAKMPGDGPTWIGGLCVLKDDDSVERMFAGYVKIKPPLEAYQHGLVEWNPEINRFELVKIFEEGRPIYPTSHAILQEDGGIEYVYFKAPYPLTRVPAKPEALADLSRYEAYTCLVQGGDLENPELDRDENGVLRYSWKTETAPVYQTDQNKLVEKGLMKPEEGLLQLRDIETGKTVLAHHSATVHWNEFRNRWVMITVEIFGGPSTLGEVWYAEADTLLGPWIYARKVLTHDQYTYYNPRHHPFFDQEGGRLIYFEGTYTNSFSGNPDQTPRYDYNQVMYRLDLEDPRLNLPVAVYQKTDADGRIRYRTRGESSPEPGETVAFFALDRPGEGTLPVFEGTNGELKLGEPVEGDDDSATAPLFFVLSASADAEDAPEPTVPLFEVRDENGKARRYTTDRDSGRPGDHLQKLPIAQVWPNPGRSQGP